MSSTELLFIHIDEVQSVGFVLFPDVLSFSF